MGRERLRGRLVGPGLGRGTQDLNWALLASGVASAQALLAQWELLGDWGP